MKRYRTNMAAFVLITLFVLVSQTARAADRPSDQEITSWVKEALHEDPRVDALDVNVSTEDGIVKLGGMVRNVAAKKYADLEAKKIKGVGGVINEIVVSWRARSDTDISQEIFRRFLNSADIIARDIWVKVTKGQVTLTGDVNSWPQKQEAKLIAAEVRGVRSLRNELEIRYKKHRSDDEIRKDIIAAIDRDVYLNGLPISVQVENGIVTLKGSVTGAYQKERAANDALSVENVRDVKNFIEIKWWENKRVRQQALIPTDEQLKKSVLDELYQDWRISDPFKIDVESVDGHITLRGSVPSMRLRRLVAEDARDVVGVVWVNNYLLVRTAWREDSAIEEAIQFELGVDYALHGQDVEVRVKDGIVTLSGTVNTFYEKTHAAEVASRVLGVRDVFNNIKVNWAPRYADTALRDQIRKRLLSNAETQWVADRIGVTVKDGRATLTGDVDTWSEYREAARVAFHTEGVRGLDNRLALGGKPHHWEEWK